MRLDVMTYNIQSGINYMTKETELFSLAKVIKKYKADIVGLNEVWDRGDIPGRDRQTGRLSELSGLSYHKFAKAIEFGSGVYGNGFLSGIPVKNAAVIPIPDPKVKTGTDYYESRCLLKVVLLNGVTVLLSHFGLNRDELQNAAETVIKNIEPEKCILMGDFNVTPDDKILDGLREKMTDTAEFLKKPLLSWPSDKPEMKIDYIFVSRDGKVLSADIPAETVSDHRPYIAEIEF